MQSTLKLIFILFIALTAIVFFFRRDIQTYAVKDNALKFCQTRVTDQSAACETKVHDNFARCIQPLLDKQVNTDGFFSCLGIAEPKTVEVKNPEPIVLVSCDQLNFAAQLELRIGQSEPSEHLKAYSWEDKTVYANETPDMSNQDLTKMTLSYEAGKSILKIEFTKDGKAKLAKITSKNINKNMAVILNGSLESFPVILSTISSSYALISLKSSPSAETICRK